ncbi:MAG: 1-(5-phosphoribosyl)-5-[(5-phosphoribosylamino)methylideneamino]imidazole-4-carboxamide isomerase [bacterium]|jgi:phosphoribosylformimino-5-aminoimidazole carboxamide ribotide isomerase
MIIFPAIDIQDGRCVRLTQGRFDSATVYSEEPWLMAEKWQSLGAEWLHVVDLDGAKAGAPQNVAVIREMLRRVNIPVQFGGGVRSLHTAEMMLTLGVSRVVVGTSLAQDEQLAAKFFNQFGEKVAVGLDARHGRVSVKGWQEDTNETAIEFAKRMEALGACRVIYTDISQDGMLQGVSLDKMREMCEAISIPVIASGGVSTLEDIKSLLPLTPLGIEGVIIGKALYAGAFDLNEAINVGK